MFFSSWLRNRNSNPRAKRAKAARPKYTRIRPLLEHLEDRCVPTAGFLDPTFNTTGVVTTPVAGPSGGGAFAVAIYAPGTANAGKIVSVGQGTGSKGVNTAFGVVRYNPDGSLDSTFGNGGIVNQTLSGNDVPMAVALVGDKILVSGFAIKSTTDEFEIARFNSDGSLDQTFGTKGMVLTAFGKSRSAAADAGAMAVQADGKIVVAGIADVPRKQQVYLELAVARYTPDGVLDTTFGNNGEMTIDVGASLQPPLASAGIQTLALYGNSIDLVGHGQYSQNVYVAQLTAAGQLEPNFGAGGVVNLGQGFDPSLTVQPDGKLVAVSYSNSSSPAGIHVTRLLANGSPDTGFGTGGTATVPWSITGWNTDSTAVKVDSLGRFVIGGYQVPNSSNNINFVVIRLTSAGALDSTFGVGGIGTSGNLVGLAFTPTVAMTLQPDGKAVLVSTTNDFKFVAARFDGDSPLLATSLPQHASSVSLTSAQAQPLLTEAEALWQAAGVDTSTLGAIDIRIAHLAGAELGLADEVHHGIWLDDNAAGWGWFVDNTPWDNPNYLMPSDQVPSDHMDLLTVLEHEVGHLLGFEHAATGVMQETLTTGVRELPNGLQPSLWSTEGNESISVLLSLEQKSKDKPM